jgi:LysR family transcriptional regulator, regulator for bpeEF and oprC
VIDLNDLRLFERVAALKSFSAASKELDVPRSSMSRSIQRLEADLGVRLMQRTTRDVTLTGSGVELFKQCAQLLGRLEDMLEYVGSLGEGPRGVLRVSAGIGFGVNVLSELLPVFTRTYPDIDVSVSLSSIPSDLVAERIDVAIRMGPLPDSQTVARRLGIIHRYCCASPDYLDRRGTPQTIDDLRNHDLIDLPVREGRQSTWVFTRDGERQEHRQAARVTVDCALTIHKMLVNHGGIGLSSGYLCAPEIAAGRLVRLFPDWSIPSVPVHALFPSQRQLAPAVRAFVDFMTEHSKEGHHWQEDPMYHRNA